MVLRGHVFISYVREDSLAVDRLQQQLEAGGVPVWRDTAELWPGEDWRLRIQQAITNDSLVFLACFSDHSARRTRSYQREELLLAVEQLRLRPPSRPWLVPVRLADCELPALDLGAGRTLDSLQRVDLFDGHWDPGIDRLVTGVHRIVTPAGKESVTPSDEESSDATLPVDRERNPTPHWSRYPLLMAAIAPVLGAIIGSGIALTGTPVRTLSWSRSPSRSSCIQSRRTGGTPSSRAPWIPIRRAPTTMTNAPRLPRDLEPAACCRLPRPTGLSTSGLLSRGCGR